MIIETTFFRITVDDEGFKKFCRSEGLRGEQIPLLSCQDLPAPVQFGETNMAQYDHTLRAIIFHRGGVEEILGGFKLKDRPLAIAIALAHELGHVICLTTGRRTPVGRLHNRARDLVCRAVDRTPSASPRRRALFNHWLREALRVRELAANIVMDEILGRRKKDLLAFIDYQKT